jgi:hypothetical protein
MDPSVVQRVKTIWFVAWLCVTGFALAVWGTSAAVAVSLAFVGASILAFTAFILNLLMGEEPVAYRVILILLFCIGLVVEICGIAGAFGLLSR